MDRHGKAEGNTVGEIQINGQNIDMETLIKELDQLRKTLSDQADSDAEYEEITKLSSAKKAAKAGDCSEVVHILKSLGPWTLKAVTDIGTKVIASIISNRMGY